MRKIKFAMLLFFVATFGVGSSGAYFTDSVGISTNNISTSSHFSEIEDSSLVINEVYYDVDSGHGAEGDDEWVELYNPSDAEVDIKDWTLADNSGSDIRIINSRTILAPKSFVLMSKAANTFSLYWDLSHIDKSQYTEVRLGHNIGNGLANGGDRLILKDSLGNTVDAISWGSDTTILNPSIPVVSDGHSISRSPNGHDTGSNSDFIDNITPTPGE